MHRRWLILIVLTLARATMGFQFQGVAALGPALSAETAISYAALGMLMGAYLLPGALFAIPGGWLGKRFGDKRIVLAGLAMMTIGGACLALSEIYAVMITGRLISGVGAVLLNVLVTKMVTDWFIGQRIVGAMGILLSSWPLGIAVALLTMGPLAVGLGLAGAFAIPVIVCALSLALVAVVYAPPGANEDWTSEPDVEAHPGLSRYELWGALLSGCVWCFYNVAFILPLSFGPEFLTEKGMGLSSAGAVTSLMSWLIIPALPLGGWLAEHMRRPVLTMILSFLAIALFIWLIPLTTHYVVLFVILGVIFGPAGGLIMALPAQVLCSKNRAVGMGIYFSVYYVGMGVFPAVAGYLRDVTGNSAAPLWFAGAMSLVALLSLIGFRILVSRQPGTGDRPRS